MPIPDAVEQAIRRVTENGFRDKVFMFNPTIESSHPMASAEIHEILQPEE